MEGFTWSMCMDVHVCVCGHDPVASFHIHAQGATSATGCRRGSGATSTWVRRPYRLTGEGRPYHQLFPASHHTNIKCHTHTSHTTAYPVHNGERATGYGVSLLVNTLAKL